MSEIVVSKFGGTSVADFDAMNRSADIVLSGCQRAFSCPLGFCWYH